MKQFLLLLMLLPIVVNAQTYQKQIVKEQITALENLKTNNAGPSFSIDINALNNGQAQDNITVATNRTLAPAPGYFPIVGVYAVNNSLQGNIAENFSYLPDNATYPFIWRTQEVEFIFSYNEITSVPQKLILADKTYIAKLKLDHNKIKSIDFDNFLDVTSSSPQGGNGMGATRIYLNQNDITSMSPLELGEPMTQYSAGHGLIGMAADTVRIDNNRLNMGKLIEAVNFINKRTSEVNPGGMPVNTYFKYLPQKPWGSPSEVTNVEGNKFSLSIDESHSSNVYQWQLNGKDVALTSAKSITKILDTETAGVWRCKITNPLRPDAVIYSADQAVWLEKASNKTVSNIISSTTEINPALPEGAIVCSFSATDPDGDEVYYRLVEEGDYGSFRILDGKTLITAEEMFPYDFKTDYTLTVEAYDVYGGTFTQAFTFEKGDAPNVEVPANISLSNNKIAENLPLTVIGQFETTGVEGYSFSLKDEKDNNYFVIEGNNLKTNNKLNFENKANYEIRVTCNKGNVELKKDFTITCTNANDNPHDVITVINKIATDLPIGTTISPLFASDEDATDTHIIKLIDNTTADNAEFAIENNVLRTNKVFKLEDVGAKTIRVKAIDNNGGELLLNLIFQVFTPDNIDPNNNNAPSGIGFDQMILRSSLSMGDKISKLFVEDVDGGTDYTWSILSASGTQAEYFEIVGKELRLSKVLSKDINSYSVKIEVSDGKFIYSGTYLFFCPESEQTSVLKNKSLENTLKVYPNPVVSNCAVLLENTYTGQIFIEVYNMSGKMIKRLEDTKNTEAFRTKFNLDCLDKGIYFLRCVYDNKVETAKIQKL